MRAIPISELPLGSRFRTNFGLEGRLVGKSPSCATVVLDRARPIVIHGQVKGHRAERATWCLATSVEPVAETAATPASRAAERGRQAEAAAQLALGGRL